MDDVTVQSIARAKCGWVFTLAGIQAAVAGDIPVIALTVGHPRAKLEAAGATHVLDNFGELFDLVKKTQE